MNDASVPDFFLEDEELHHYHHQKQEQNQVQQQFNRLSCYDEEFLEILWQEGVVVQLVTDAELLQTTAAMRSDTSGRASTSEVEGILNQEDEMATWLQQEISRVEDVEGRGRLYGEVESSPDLAAERTDSGETMADGSNRKSAPKGTDRTGETEPRVSSPPAASGSVQQLVEIEKEEHKRKATTDAEFGSMENKKNACKSASATRKHAAEVHNLSERRRRDRINEKIKALQELLPRCNKQDKASILHEAIEYVKALQLQIQIMSMSYNIVPVMCPGMQPYLTSHDMRMGTGAGMPMQGYLPPYGHLFLGSQIPGPSTVHAGARLFVPSMDQVGMSISDQFQAQPSSISDAAISN